MTVLGLKLSRRANAVSALHGEVSRAMWTGLYPGTHGGRRPDRPHHQRRACSDLARAADVPALRPAPGRRAGANTAAKRRMWEGIENVDDGELWETHLTLKARLLDFVRRRAVEQAERRGGTAGGDLQRLGRVMSPDALTIGFARRFATYKRANLCSPTSNGSRRWSTIPSGRCSSSSPARRIRSDEPGKRVLQQIACMMRDQQFAGKFVFVEDYDINVARFLVQGVDVWLNNPRRPLEASGTSGQKVVLNGGLNLSVLDGWWAEAYDGLNGFAIGTGRTHTNMNVHDERDGDDLYRVLRDEVIPLYYQRDRGRPAARLDPSG